MTTQPPSLNPLNRRVFSAILIAALLTLAWLGALDHYTYDYLKGSLLNALASYGVSRSLNAVISMFSTSTISIGVASLSVGELLDPLNDLIERFSELLTFATGSIAIQKVLLTIVSSNLFNVILSVFGLGLIVALFRPNQPGLGVLSKLFLLTIFLRLSLSLMLLLNLAVDHTFIEPGIQSNQQKIEHLAHDLDELNQTPQTPQAMRESLAKLQQQRPVLVTRLQNQQTQLITRQAQIEEQIERIEQLRQALPLWERLNIFKQDNALSQAKARLDRLENRWSQASEALETLQDDLETLDERIARYERRLAGQTDSMMDSINQGLTSFASTIRDVDIFKIQAQLEASVESLLNLMMLYLLKTLLLPLLFMYLLIKGFKQIWQVNLTTWLKPAPTPETKKAA
ncbi:hypothetical protein AVO42_04440 [Thiomicrospira sp. XS5]|uniref:hypothetical protein n=1 Tax=Thiomicrospira sp. XS5 TaxID=1775636 RepID=UPI000748C740|nr:hypothetical protein [Thiomicrospira sp. XS5]KUJ74649.1 hypothetical protein AVO42_04440 [Thiomicrospira sp. XS5]